MVGTREERGAAILAQGYVHLDILAARCRAYIDVGDAEMAGRTATLAGTEVGYLAWVQATLHGTPHLAPMSPRPGDGWHDNAHCQHRTEPLW